MSVSIEELPLAAPFTAKWQKMLALVDRPGRAAVQSYNDGKVKIVRDKSVSMMTRHEIDKAHNIDRPPTWRAILDKEEARKLWKVQVFLMYYRHHQIWGAHFYKIHNNTVATNGGQNLDLDMIDDPKQRQRALRANGAAEQRDQARDDAREHRGKQQILEKFLIDLSAEHRVGRNVEHTRLKENEMFKQEQMRERARRAALQEFGSEEAKPKAKKRKKKIVESEA